MSNPEKSLAAGDETSLRDAPRFWRVFCRVVGEKLTPANYRASELGQWDSLRHIELIFELEEQFEVDIAPESIVELYSDTDTILAYLRRHGTL